MNKSTNSYKRTDFNDFVVHEPTQAGNDLHGHYDFTEIYCTNEIIINDVELAANYQTGMSYLYSDYRCPDPALAFSPEYSAKELRLLDGLSENVFDDPNCHKYLNEVLSEIQGTLPFIKNLEDLLEFYLYFRDNCPSLQEFI